MRVLILDNYDSFTWNLVQLLGEVMAELHAAPPAVREDATPVDGPTVHVLRNDKVDLAGIRGLDPSHLVLSPGPGHPAVARDFGVCAEAIDGLDPAVPVLGVCLGHQGICLRLGGEVVRAPQVVHGMASPVTHDGQGLFAGLPQPLSAMRYHSLMVEPGSVPEALEVSARTADGLVMAVRHRQRPLVGLQFHPESIGTPDGKALLRNFLAMGAPRSKRAAA